MRITHLQSFDARRALIGAAEYAGCPIDPDSPETFTAASLLAATWEHQGQIPRPVLAQAIADAAGVPVAEVTDATEHRFGAGLPPQLIMQLVVDHRTVSEVIAIRRDCDEEASLQPTYRRGALIQKTQQGESLPASTHGAANILLGRFVVTHSAEAALLIVRGSESTAHPPGAWPAIAVTVRDANPDDE